MINNIIDYSKAIFFQENIQVQEDIEDFINIENQAIVFYKNCMKNNIENSIENSILKKIKEEYKLLIKETLNKEFIIFGKNEKEFIVTRNSKKDLIEFIEEHKKENKESIELNIFDSLPLFYISKDKLYIPELVDLRKDYVYLGNFRVYISIKGDNFE